MSQPLQAAPVAEAAQKPGLPPTFQDVIMNLQRYWADQGCVILQPYDNEVGGGDQRPGHHAALPRPRHLANRLRAGLPQAYRRTLRREPEPHPVLLPVPGAHEALVRTTSRTFTWAACAPSASMWTPTTCASSRTTGSHPPWAPGALAGRCGSTAWRLPSSLTSSRWAASNAAPCPSRSPTGWSA